MISTRDLSGLPEIERLRRTIQSMAMLDAILCPEWQFRYYSFNAAWADGEQMGSMRNGSGDDLFVLFNEVGCWIKGFAHEAAMSSYRDDGSTQVWPGVLDAVPPGFAACLVEPAFKVADSTFCLWRRSDDPSWQRGPIDFPAGYADPDGSKDLLSPLDGKPETYRDWAQDYYERSVALEAVRRVYAQEPLTDDVLRLLSPSMSLALIRADVEEIAYPR